MIYKSVVDVIDDKWPFNHFVVLSNYQRPESLYFKKPRTKQTNFESKLEKNKIGENWNYKYVGETFGHNWNFTTDNIEISLRI